MPDHAPARGALQLHRLVAQGQVADLGMVEGLAPIGVALDVVALPHARELGALEQEFADQLRQVRCVRFGAGQAAQSVGAAADLMVPVVLAGQSSMLGSNRSPPGLYASTSPVRLNTGAGS